MLIKFDYKEWLKNKDLKVVDKNSNSLYLYEYKDKHVVFLDGKVQDVEDAQIYFWVDDPSDHTAKNTPVSDFAKTFQREPDQIKVKVLECIKHFIDMAGIFGHYDFFTKKLWKKVKGYESADEAEVIAAFLHWWTRFQYGFNTMPVGSGWCGSYPSCYKEDDECYEDYIRDWMPLFIAYSQWCSEQR